MKFMKPFSPWSCLPTAFAMASGRNLQALLTKIGHDGSDILWPDLPEPHCRRAFHITECVAALYPDFAVTELPLIAKLSPDGQRIFEIKMEYPQLEFWTGVATGVRLATGNRHAVAFDMGKYYDPLGQSYPMSIDLQNQFRPDCFFRIDLIL